jgi:enolase-phosphatase E1
VLGPAVHSATNRGTIARVEVLAAQKIRVILLDIEGTTTPADFVYRTLFPYAQKNLEAFLKKHFREPSIESAVRDLHLQNDADRRNALAPPQCSPQWTDEPEEARLRSAVEYSQWLMARDSKCTPLKALQGAIWQEGYARGELRGEVYADVPPAFARWRGQGKQICIYSSGSELAQRLLFSSVASGDLTPCITRFFDTRVGAKANAESYRRICREVGHAAEAFLFISDSLKEVESAAVAGMQVAICVREPDGTAAPSPYPVIHNFDHVLSDKTE